jgi:prepilin-type N-terminal cleavage/methylation domain-containing protein
MLTAPVSHPRRGLTLLELVVVMAILVALGGLLVPLLGNFLHRANVASCTVNIPEMDKWIQTYVNLHAEYPDKMDNLCDATAGTELSYVLDGETGDFEAKSFEPKPLATEEADALREAGITTLCKLVEKADATDPGVWNPTFWPYGVGRLEAPNTTAVAKDVYVATLTETGARLMGLPWGGTTNKYKYVIFGMNAPCTLFRNTVEEVPYHYADTPSEDPATYYMCFGAVFMVRNGDDEVAEKAVYKGTIAFHDFGLSTAGMHTQEWWDRLKTERPNK